MHSFLNAILAFCIVQAATAESNPLVKVTVTKKGGIRSSCSSQEVQAIDMFLNFHMNLAGVVTIDQEANNDATAVCHDQACQGQLSLPFNEEDDQTLDEFLNTSQQEILDTCASLVKDLSVDAIFETSCRNVLRNSVCQVSLLTTQPAASSSM